MNEIEYRKLEWSDIECFTQLRILQLKEECATSTFDLTQSLKAYYEKHLDDGTFVSWLALKDNEIIATSGISFVEKPPYYSNPSGKIGILSSMYTISTFRRKGIARKLLELIVAEAKNYGCGTIHITASDVGVHLYENFGFVKNNNFLYYNLD